MPTLYSPGESLVAATPHGVVVLEPGSPVAVAAQVRALVAEGRGLGGVIEALTGAYGASLSTMPSFAVALAEGGNVRVAVRGAFVLQVESGRPESISGEGVTTWSERVLEGVARVTVSSTVPTASGSPELPVEDGVILASVVAWEPAGEGAAPAPAPKPAPTRAATRAPQPSAAMPAPAPAQAATPPPQAQPAPPDVPPVPPVPPALEPASHGDLIDSSSVPSVASLAGLRSEPPAGSVPVEVPRDSGGDDPLLETIVRGSEPPAAPPVAGDHDGETVSLAQARAMRGGTVPTSSLPPLAPPRPPSPGRLRVSDGQVVALDRTVVIGRRPRSTRVSGTDLPHLVAVDSPQQDISRSHVEVRVEGDSIVATDLRTTNGTTLRRPGTDPVRLHPGEGTVVVPGDVLDLGDGITVAVEEPS